jgi:signal transduction histidine kinase
MTKILIIEDERPLREEIALTLSYEGYDVSVAADGVDGVNSAEANPPDLILCDISMPRLDGYGVLLRLQANPDLRSTPFFFLTARADREDVRTGMQLGADDYLTKPFTRSELLEAIESRLGKRAYVEAEHRQELDVFVEALAREQQRSLFRQKLAAMFAHDLRNQVAVITTAASMMRLYYRRMTDEDRIDRILVIEGVSKVIQGMLQDMLTLAQIESGTIKLQPKRMDVAQFLQDLVDELKAGESSLPSISVTCEGDSWIVTDVRFLRQIAANLISNAIKYSDAQSEIQVHAENHDTYFTITVKDHGIGIPEADLGRLLSAFQRGSNVGHIAGTGLGLAIVKQAIDFLGGKIEIGSQVNVGTTMTAQLPVLAVEDQAGAMDR